jgi:maleate cis-trans isomerase
MNGTATTRIGLIVPSSDVTVETEVPALLPGAGRLLAAGQPARPPIQSRS